MDFQNIWNCSQVKVAVFFRVLQLSSQILNLHSRKKVAVKSCCLVTMAELRE